MAAEAKEEQKVYVITGCSSGIGLEMARQAAAAGHKVFATVRTREASVTKEDLISAVEGDVTILEGVDVTDDKVGEVLAASPLAGVTIDVLIHNAGSYDGEPGMDGGSKLRMRRWKEEEEEKRAGPL